MNRLLIIALAVCAVAADITSVQYAGTTSGGATWTPPTLQSGSPCVAGSDSYTYVKFNATFPTAGVREVSAMAEKQFKDHVRVYIYRGGFPTDVCSGLAHSYVLAKELDTGNGGPPVDAFVYFAADTYTFVVTGEYGGLFAAHIDPTDATGQTSAASPTWSPPTLSSSCQPNSGDGYGFDTYTWVQQTTGQFDVFVFFNNDTNTGSMYLYAALYQGAPTTSSISLYSCNASNILQTYNSEYRGLYFPASSLTAGQNYTLAFSLESGEYGYWGVHTIPTRIRRFDGASGYEQPRSSTFPGCTANSGYSSTPYGVTFFQAQQRVYILDTANPPAPYTSIDTYSFLYAGANTASPPTTCPIFAPLVLEGDTGDTTPIYSSTIVGRNYTAVVSSFQSGQTIEDTDAYALYFYTGLPIGALPTTSASTLAGSLTGFLTGSASRVSVAVGLSLAALSAFL